MNKNDLIETLAEQHEFPLLVTMEPEPLEQRA